VFNNVIFTGVLISILFLPLKETLFLGEEKNKSEVRMKSSKLYVGNLSYSVTNEKVEKLFSNYGEVMQIKIIEGKGFGFVEMSNRSEAEKAKEALNGTDFEGRNLRVNEALPSRSKSGHKGGFNGGQRGGYRRY
jgi:RNA recognition motif-containing protein